MDQTYTGVENLEVMAEAVRYNAYLLGLVARHLPPAGEDILDFGAGSGTFARSFRGQGVRVSCIEPDATMRKALQRERLQAFGSLSELRSRQFGLIYSLNVLEHIYEDLAALVELRHHLAVDGKLFLYVPAFPILYSSMDRKVGHFRRYRRAQLVNLLREAGYAVHSARYVDCLGFVASIAYRLLGRDDGTINRRALAIYDRWFFPFSILLDRVTGRWFGKNLAIVAGVARSG